jgi:ribosome-associated translation inhibitor RaiA
MQTDIHGLDFSLTMPIKQHTNHRLHSVLERYSERVKRVVVRMGDNNGPRGGEDKYCVMQIYLKDAKPVLIRESGSDLYSVITRVTSRVGRAIARRACKVKSRPKRFKRMERYSGDLE